MKLDKEKVSQIQTVLHTDDEGVEFTEDTFENGLWYITNHQVNRFGKEEGENNESEIEHTYSKSVSDLSYDEFYKEIEGKELVARIFLGWSVGNPQYETITEWHVLAKVLGISKLVTVATKIPQVVAKRFEVFANQTSDRSSVLRDLVYQYVKKQMIEQADRLMFKEEI